jgi:prepilin-type N-terminal cleavage/methylation domain-containing protein
MRECPSILGKRYFQPAGFTLAELLIALLIIGEIAAFTIPKILSAQQKNSYNASAKEVAGILGSAWANYSMSNTISASTQAGALTSYFNYVKVSTSGTIDNVYRWGTISCTASQPCYFLHNGGVLHHRDQFGGTSTTHALVYDFDPDGAVTDGTTNGPGKSVQFVIFYNGRLTSRGTVNYSIYACSTSCATWGADTTADPPWFSW